MCEVWSLLACVGLLGLGVGFEFGAHFLKLGFEESLRWTRETRVWHFGVWAIRGFQFVDLEKVRDLKSVWKDLDWFGVRVLLRAGIEFGV